MLWLDSITAADSLPAIWLIASGEAPRNRPERTSLRHGISRQIIAAQTGIKADQVVLSHDSAGRLLPFGSGLRTIHISHATRNGFVAVALASGPVGVDVEAVDAGPIPVQALHLAERTWLVGLPESRRPEAFAQLWAAKEAHGKWAGTGLVEPDRFPILPDQTGGWIASGLIAAVITTRLVVRNGTALAVAVAH